MVATSYRRKLNLAARSSLALCRAWGCCVNGGVRVTQVGSVDYSNYFGRKNLMGRNRNLGDSISL